MAMRPIQPMCDHIKVHAKSKFAVPARKYKLPTSSQVQDNRRTWTTILTLRYTTKISATKLFISHIEDGRNVNRISAANQSINAVYRNVCLVWRDSR